MDQKKAGKKYYSSIKISLIYLLVSSIYIIFSDHFITFIFGQRFSVELLTTIQTYKGLVFVFLTSVILFVLIQREIKAKRVSIHELELQKQNLLNLSTENEKIKKRHQERNFYIETILKNLPIGLAVNKIDNGDTIYMNKYFTNIYGWSEKELDNLDNFFKNVYPDEGYRKTIKERFLGDINSGDPNRMRWEGIEITTRSGEKKIINAQNIPLNDQNLMISTVQDTSEQKKAELKIIESEKKFRAIFENSLTAIFIADDKGDYISVNDAAVNLFGYTKEEFLRMNVGNLTTPSGDIKQKYKEYQERGYDMGEMDFIIKTGEHRTALYHAIRISENFNLSVMMDITEKKNHEKQITESNTLLEKIVDNLNETVLLVDPGGRYIQRANAMVEKMFGYTQQEIIGKTTELLHVNRKMFEEFGKLSEPILEKNNVFHAEFQLKHKDGSILHTDNTVTSIKEKDGWKLGVVSVIRDITKRKESKERLKEYQKSLKQLTTEISLAEEKQRKEIAGNIHDHLSQLLVISRIKLNDLINETSNRELTNALKPIIKIISEALENTRKITYDLSPPILYELGLMETMYWLAEKTQEEHQIKTSFSTALKEIKLPESNLILIFRIIQELVNNTVKHAQAKNLGIEINVINEFLEIIVTDDGKGFNINALPKTKIGEGGFGLFAVKERVQNLDGKISIESKRNKGTFVKINLPL